MAIATKLSKLKTWGDLVAISHTVFALPFAASAVVLAHSQPHAPLTPLRGLALLGCMVTARSSAMAFNRWADRDVDAKNPRTAARPVPAGKVSPREALALTIASGLAFCAIAATLGFWPMVLAPPVLLVLLGYSFAKRFTWAAHAWLGLALALAPGGAWLGMGAQPNAGIVALMVAVLTWLLGFDVLYALQDEAFDKKEGLFSIPARFGGANARRIAAAAHVVTVACLAGAGLLLQRGIVYALGVAAVAVVLVIEHRLVRGDLSKIQKAFFDCNAYVSLGFFATTLLDTIVR
jgi:4-hydroxybenzoate polyprenyltransferase